MRRTSLRNDVLKKFHLPDKFAKFTALVNESTVPSSTVSFVKIHTTVDAPLVTVRLKNAEQSITPTISLNKKNFFQKIL